MMPRGAQRLNERQRRWSLFSVSLALRSFTLRACRIELKAMLGLTHSSHHMANHRSRSTTGGSRLLSARSEWRVAWVDGNGIARECKFEDGMCFRVAPNGSVTHASVTHA